jgi:hypothetical protein
VSDGPVCPSDIHGNHAALLPGEAVICEDIAMRPIRYIVAKLDEMMAATLVILTGNEQYLKGVYGACGCADD